LRGGSGEGAVLRGLCLTQAALTWYLALPSSWRQVGFIGFIEFVEFIEFIELIETGDWRLETREQDQMTKPKCQTKLKIQMSKCQDHLDTRY